MVAMPVGDENVRDALGRLLRPALEGRIAGEKRIDEHDLVGEIEPECGMSEPGDLHGVLAVSRR